MRWCLVLAAVATSLLAGCAYDRQHRERPARLLVGANARDLAGSESDVALRQASPTPSQEAAAHGAYTATMHFTVPMRGPLYGGMEVEAGQLDTRGSNFAGAYGVLGAEHATRMGSIGVELAGGWRGLRYQSGVDDVHAYIAEPRVRGQLRVGPQLSLGAVAGATLGERGSWMAGLYLGVHSHVFGQ